MEQNGIYPANWGWSKQSSFTGPTQLGVEKWKVSFENTLSISSPVIDQEANIIFGTNRGQLICINKDGEVLWKNQVTSGNIIGPTINSSRSLIIVSKESSESELVILTSSGEVIKRYRFNNEAHYPPILSQNDEILIATWDNLIKFNAEGDRLWHFACMNISSCPVIDESGNVYFTSREDGGVLISLNSEGQLCWKKKFAPCFLEDDPVMDTSGNIYLAAAREEPHHALFSIDQQGEIKWKFELTNGGIIGSPAISQEGHLVMGITGFQIVALDLNGNLLWQAKVGEMIQSTPILDSRNQVYFYTHVKKKKVTSNLWCYNRRGNLLWSQKINHALNWFGFSPYNGLVTRTIDPDTYLLELTAYSVEKSI
ncbi:PQQ-binding-like beta-propeller repeat protein [Paenibacillus caui]|uniref:outer membrane protein assembly factor BamB family protein n=1 Tax=Paenibacillus caui TaxID=2873927 RepID=UPI001CAA1D5B|nr:PQQ-binding-like beta-propeller repeat protein [Paenibacillus caui]